MSKINKCGTVVVTKNSVSEEIDLDRPRRRGRPKLKNSLRRNSGKLLNI